MTTTWTFTFSNIELPAHELAELRDEFEALISRRLKIEARNLRRVVEREGF